MGGVVVGSVVVDVENVVLVESGGVGQGQKTVASWGDEEQQASSCGVLPVAWSSSPVFCSTRQLYATRSEWAELAPPLLENVSPGSGSVSAPTPELPWMPFDILRPLKLVVR